MIKLNSMAPGRYCRRLFTVLLALALTGCLAWWRAYQVYQQLDEFDRNFTVTVADDFTLGFKHPVMYSEDLVSLSGLFPSVITPERRGQHWRYRFRKVDAKYQAVKPEVKFYFDLSFNRYDRLSAWAFSPLFLQIAPPEFLEVSLRSLAGAEINKGAKQIKTRADQVGKVSAALPKKAVVLRALGAPVEVVKAGADEERYLYYFLLDSLEIKRGYESRALSQVKLTFDTSTQELIKMSGRFAGLKISISYRNYLDKTQAAL